MKERFDAAAAALRNGDWPQARNLALELIPEMPSSAALHFIAGAAALELRLLPPAIECLSRAANLDPNRADYLAQLSRAFVAVRMNVEALAAAEKAWALSPQAPMTLDTLGVVFSRLNQHASAAEVFGKLVDSNPQRASYRFNLATSLVISGDTAAAEAQLEQCLRLDPSFWKAYPALSKLRKQTEASNHVECFLTVLSNAVDTNAAIYVNLALAMECEDLGRYPQAFEYLTRSKTIVRANKEYSIARDEAMFEAIQQNFPGLAAPAVGHRGNEPIFVFGMPRSGTTLVERILSSHSMVCPAGELEDFGHALKRASGSTTPYMLDPDTAMRARNLDWAALGEAYLAGINPDAGGRPRFVDKLPQNFLYAGHIANALPMAKMVCVRRQPMDTCLGNFRQLFSQESRYYDYSLDILDIGRYYILFNRLMSYWERLLPGRILVVSYESLVREQEARTRELLDYCGLPWEEACLRFKDNAAPVATASALQVREPMNSSSIGRWKNYETQLAPLRRLLEAAGIEIRDPA